MRHLLHDGLKIFFGHRNQHQLGVGQVVGFGGHIHSADNRIDRMAVAQEGLGLRRQVGLLALRKIMGFLDQMRRSQFRRNHQELFPGPGRLHNSAFAFELGSPVVTADDLFVGGPLQPFQQVLPFAGLAFLENQQ